ncbi:hypothetical protein OVA24_18580 [Luteolibacter sp. SL250]|uniref:hypothetical protein n=1 Tax=Luteolibacter sp. SL250 TaxID=2995170 RepID=UPI0022708ABA|nr:hypothetical protein [Luteolibacter sp. SL250]WAC19235.1 hypothetical protein OVA24_18580 [Luteolibacter sp. SL250]
MSLKGFHIVFVTVSTLLFVFLALWAFVYMQEATTLTRVLGGIGIAGATVMPVYGVLFYRKATRLHL